MYDFAAPSGCLSRTLCFKKEIVGTHHALMTAFCLLLYFHLGRENIDRWEE